MEKELRIASMLLRKMVNEKYNRNFNLVKKILNSYENVINNYKYIEVKDFDKEIAFELLKQAKTLEKLKIEIVEHIIPVLIESDEYSSVETLTNISNRLFKIYGNINKDFSKFIPIKTSNNKAEKLLKTSLDNGVLIALYDNDNNRGIGKTTELIKHAYKNDATIVVSNHESKKYIEVLAKSLDLNVDVKYINSFEAVQEIPVKNNKFIVDEMVNQRIVKELIKNGKELLGGFINLFNASEVKIKTFKDYLEEELKSINDEIDILNYTYTDSFNKKSDKYIKLLRRRDLIKELIEDKK